MSTPKFTPGPWKLIYDVDEGRFEIGMASYLIDDSCYDTVHHLELYDGIWPEDKSDFAEARANAHLIAAAPEMYEALAGLSTLICNVRDLYGNDAAEWISKSETFAKAQAALAKAEGKQP